MTSFESFIKGSLINHNVVSGVILTTCHGQVVFSHGSMTKITQDEINQFLNLFDRNPYKGSTNGSVLKDFCVRDHNGQSIIYKSYQKTYASIYATATHNSGGMAVCNLPYGILVCVYGSTTNPGQAIKVIEQFCDIMRR